MKEDIPPPSYQIRVSKKARHVRLYIRPHAGLEVVVPARFNLALIPEIVQKHQRWIERTSRRLNLQATQLPAAQTTGSIERLPLSALDEVWDLEFKPVATSRPSLRATRDRRLLFSCASDDRELIQTLLGAWLRRYARQRLVPWLTQISTQTRLPFRRVSIRGQRTLWGSCSAKADISLNYKLLFLPAPLVEYVLGHELCHTRHLNHSKRFWRLVGTHLPDYRDTERQLKSAWTQVPTWLELYI
jgi:hypothetical protein